MFQNLLTFYLLLLFISLLFSNKKSNILGCGIIGFSGIGGKTFDPIKIAYLMFHNSVERGKDSTGTYTPKKGITKSIDDAKTFLSANPLEVDNMFIGHVRAATVGGKSINNTHPFQKENIIGVHNGTLTNHWELARKRDISTSTIFVDSEVIIHCLAHDQHPKVLKELKGAAAVLFTDNTAKENTLYAYRNPERPLFRGSSPEGMYISSLEDSLKIIGCTEIKEFKEYNLYTIVDGKLQGLPTKLTPKKEPVIATTPTYGSAFNQEAAKYVGYWLKFDSRYSDIKGLVVGNYYLITAFSIIDNISNYHTISETGETVKCSRFMFSTFDALIEEGEFGLASGDLYFTGKSKKAICKAGDVLRATKVKPEDKIVYCETVPKDPLEMPISFNIPFDCFKRISSTQERELNKKMLEEEAKNNIIEPEIVKEPVFLEINTKDLESFKDGIITSLGNLVKHIDDCMNIFPKDQNLLIDEIKQLKNDVILTCDLFESNKISDKDERSKSKNSERDNSTVK